MKYKDIIIEKKDFVYLKSMLNVAGFDNNRETRESLEKLRTELLTAIVLNEGEMPSDVIRFNSKIAITIDGSRKINIQLVKPALKDVANNKISILTPMGSALIGYAEGDQLLWEFPSGMKKITILKVEQEDLTPQRKVAI
ncbi:MAG: transcription elongation factor GreAB [Flavobacteriales bacterium]|nr:transcription elongation factor GreAB [Flavobacteriales bacterium]|tara:strand:+ start:4799 stop:5218 length:420 start_codon:yes stop_codon:yes gene_type:complete